MLRIMFGSNWPATDFSKYPTDREINKIPTIVRSIKIKLENTLWLICLEIILLVCMP